MREFAFELAMCARLETPDRVVSRQLGAGVHGRRVLDTVVLEPGPGFDERAALSPDTVPPALLDADLGAGRARHWQAAFDCHPERARDAIDAGVERGVLERERRNGRTFVRLAARYPDDWFDEVLAVEHKPDLDRPGDLARQLRTDVSLAAVDRVVLATASHVTGAHRNRIPDAVGIWRVDPHTGEWAVRREATALPVDEPGIEPVERHAGRTDVRVVDVAAKRRLRRTLAERAYGKGWRTYDLPACANCEPDDAGRPHCTHHGRSVRASEECGPACAGYEAARAPNVDRAGLRATRSAWEPEAQGPRRQVGLGRYGD